MSDGRYIASQLPARLYDQARLAKLLGMHDAGRAALDRLTTEFASVTDPEVARWVGQAWFDRGYDLYRRGGHLAEAEAAYRQAIARDQPQAWLYLGILLATRPGRERDEAAALRTAMASDEPATAAWAALHLGNLLNLMYDDRSEARACFEFAEKHGNQAVAFDATGRLARLLAYEGDTEAARDRARRFAIWIAAERNADMSGRTAGIASLVLSSLFGGQYTREPWRRMERSRFHARRRRRSVIARSERLTSWSNRIKESRSGLAKRFWAWGEDDG